MKNNWFLFITLSLAISTTWNCKVSKSISSANDTEEVVEVVIIEERDLDTLVVTADDPKSFIGNNSSSFEVPDYRGTAKREHDLLDTKLALRFDWQRQRVQGKATLQLRPYFKPSNRLVLDAKGFDIHKIAIIHHTDTTDLKYEYDNQQLNIALNKTYSRQQDYTIYIHYTAKPTERPLGGSSAIQSNQGLFFVNHDGAIPDMPQQIWTQGETENNSAWFPTIDKPNERCTQEMFLTVEDRFVTLSNGLLINSQKNADGTRTDHWKMSQPHAPYLFMLAIGEFAVIKDEWNGREVSYFVEPQYEADARAIFAHTKEMLTYFSEKFGVLYPWEKYAQVVVRNFVSGAMENTTGVIFGDFVQRTQRELIDNGNDKIVAHELVHHWFGDLVTCESWANLTLNEGFANYGEYLWLEYKYGKDAADSHLSDELDGYLSTGEADLHNLIYFGYKDREDMFDFHSYNKGGCVLHMLRNYVGDEAFFEALKIYLETNAFSAVESHQLRLAFERVTGEDLNWFFNQWFFEKGHPIIDVKYDYDSVLQKVILTVQQLQNPNTYPVAFQLPTYVDIYVNKTIQRHPILINERKQSFNFDLATRPDLVTLDPDRVLLAKLSDNKTINNYIYQLQNAPAFQDRMDAISMLAYLETDRADIVQAVNNALSDPYWEIQLVAAKKCSQTDSTIAILRKLMKHPHSKLRAQSALQLAQFGDKTIVPIMADILKNQKEQSYVVMDAYIYTLRILSMYTTMQVVEVMKQEDNSWIVTTISNLFADDGDTLHLAFFQEKAKDLDDYFAAPFFENYASVLNKADLNRIEPHITLLQNIAINDTNFWKRYQAAKAIYSTLLFAQDQNAAPQVVRQLRTSVQQITTNETSSRIKGYYDNWEF